MTAFSWPNASAEPEGLLLHCRISSAAAIGFEFNCTVSRREFNERQGRSHVFYRLE